MITPALTNLLAAIRKFEAPNGYGQIYGGAKLPKGTPTDVSIMPLKGVQDLQAKMVKHGSRSTACGAYQFIRKTLAVTIAEMRLTGKEIWTPALQDRMAIFLLEKRGLSKYLAGKISREAFANNLAMEWASLPVVTAINGKKVGQSYYYGDGLNKSHHKPAAILALVDAVYDAHWVKQEHDQAIPAAPPAPEPVKPAITEPPPGPPATAKPAGAWAWFKSLFTK